MNGTVRIIGLLLLAAILAGCADVEPETAFEGTVNIDGKEYTDFKLTAPTDGLTGHVEFEVLEGGDKDITFYILDQTNFELLGLEMDLIEHIEVREKGTSDSLDYTLGPAGDYHFVFSNAHSILTGKKVSYKITYNP